MITRMTATEAVAIAAMMTGYERCPRGWRTYLGRTPASFLKVLSWGHELSLYTPRVLPSSVSEGLS